MKAVALRTSVLVQSACDLVAQTEQEAAVASIMADVEAEAVAAMAAGEPSHAVATKGSYTIAIIIALTTVLSGLM